MDDDVIAGEDEQLEDIFWEGRERVSEAFPEEFARYMHRWVTYWPKNARTGYHVKQSYNGGFVQKKSRKDPSRPAHLWGDWLVRNVERHLDSSAYEEYRVKHELCYVADERPFWLGRHMPNRTTAGCIDLDAKQYKIGGLVVPPVEHFVTMKRIYDNFPGRVWCFSSATCGLHIWRKFHRPVPAIVPHLEVKEQLGRLGLGSVEVHPMPGRCLRRPFGRDYACITPEGELQGYWTEQQRYFEDDGRTPPFEVILEAFRKRITASVRQWFDWASADERIILPTINERLSQVEDWVSSGCPVLARSARCGAGSLRLPTGLIPPEEPGELAPSGEDAVTTGPSHPSLLFPGTSSKCRNKDQGEDEPGSAPSNEDVEVEAILESPEVGRQPQAVGPAASGASEDQILQGLRRGRWALGLEQVAREGLTRPKSFGTIAHEMSKWLWWVELHDLPERERHETIVRLLGAWVRRKHNGCIARIEAGDLAAVDRQVVTAVTQARKPEGKNLSLFALYRQERSLGRYKHGVHIAPLLEADGTIPAAMPSQSRLHEVCDAPLPEAIETALSEVVVRKKMRRRDGEYPFVRFARRFLNCLGGHGGACRVNRESMYAFLGYSDPKQQLAYKKLLVRADLLRRGWEDTIRRGSQSAQYDLTSAALSAFRERAKPERVERVG